VHSSQLLLLERCGSDAISSALLCLSSTVRTKAAGLYQALAGADALLVRLSCDAVVAAYVVTPITSYCESQQEVPGQALDHCSGRTCALLRICWLAWRLSYL
jgi:hypothetical protein